MTDKSNSVLNYLTPYLLAAFALIVVLELVVTVVFGFDRFDISSNLCLFALFVAYFAESYVFVAFSLYSFFPSLVLPGKSYIMPDVLAWWYPALSRKEIVVLLEMNFFHKESTTNEMMAKNLAKVKGAVTLYEPWLFVVNGAIYCRQPGTSVISGAIQQLLIILGCMAAATLVLTGLFLVLPLAFDIWTFSHDFKEVICNNRAMERIRAETDLVGDRKTDGDT
ncbi:hypothetical protein C8J56DRAFT_982244 [Mycena floridula]|nr:hypothetical protein C8J56DRAFT_982244 [Mycena floridula]